MNAFARIAGFGVALALLWGGSALAGQYDGFRSHADSGSLKPFCRDIGGILGSASFQSGRTLGFSGFDAGGRAAMQFRPDPNDRILRDHGVKAFYLPFVQAEIGMPKSLDGFIRGTSHNGLTIAGGGLRLGVIKGQDKPWSPQVLLVGVAHAAVHQDFSVTHFGGSLVGSMGTQAFLPYLGAGVDRTRLVVRNSLVDPALNGTAVTTVESRFTAGLRVKPFTRVGKSPAWNFFYMHAAYVLLHGRSGAEAGLGLRF